ncbi:succinate dehydrogenase assembly factor 2, partial [Kappamyces sp. JEL0680]
MQRVQHYVQNTLLQHAKLRIVHRALLVTGAKKADWEFIAVYPQHKEDHKDSIRIPVPPPLDRSGESEQAKRARLVYASRKRGILETDLLLGTFVEKHLDKMSLADLEEYDALLNENDWDIYYWHVPAVRSGGRSGGSGKFLNGPYNQTRHDKSAKVVPSKTGSLGDSLLDAGIGRFQSQKIVNSPYYPSAGHSVERHTSLYTAVTPIGSKSVQPKLKFAPGSSAARSIASDVVTIQSSDADELSASEYKKPQPASALQFPNRPKTSHGRVLGDSLPGPASKKRSSLHFPETAGLEFDAEVIQPKSRQSLPAAFKGTLYDHDDEAYSEKPKKKRASSLGGKHDYTTLLPSDAGPKEKEFRIFGYWTTANYGRAPLVECRVHMRSRLIVSNSYLEILVPDGTCVVDLAQTSGLRYQLEVPYLYVLVILKNGTGHLLETDAKITAIAALPVLGIGLFSETERLQMTDCLRHRQNHQTRTKSRSASASASGNAASKFDDFRSGRATKLSFGSDDKPDSTDHFYARKERADHFDRQSASERALARSQYAMDLTGDSYSNKRKAKVEALDDFLPSLIPYPKTNNELFKYPSKSDKFAISVREHDRHRLQPGEFLNDTVIEFCLT